MPINTELSEVIDMTLDEARMSTNASRGADYRNYVKRLIRKHHRLLYDKYSWSHLEITRDNAGVSLVAGTRYYDFPSNLELQRAFTLWYKYGTTWIRLERGVGPDEYSAYDSDNDDRADPPLKWDNYDETQFEVWPIPASAGSIRFEGIKKLNKLTEESDTLDLDDLMVSLFAAAEIVAGSKQSDAELKLNQANSRLSELRALYTKDVNCRVGLGGNNDSPPNREGWPRVIAAYNERNP